jgi:hypothetical protein
VIESDRTSRRKVMGKMIAKLVALAVLVATPAAAQPSSGALGSALQKFFQRTCLADPSFSFTTGESVTLGLLIITAGVDADTGFDSSDGDNIRALSVTVTHGATGSNHTIIYEDNDGSNSLTCPDTIGAVL